MDCIERIVFNVTSCYVGFVFTIFDKVYLESKSKKTHSYFTIDALYYSCECY